MSFLDDLGSFAKNAITGFFDDDDQSLGTTLLKTVVSGYAVSKLNDNVTKENTGASTTPQTPPTVDEGVKLQVTANQNTKIPIVYGEAQLGGIITDAVMTSNNKRMTYVLTLCEKTGVKLSDGKPSKTTFQDIYYNDQRIVFVYDGQGQARGTVADFTFDRDGNKDTSINGLVQIWCYDGNSNSQVLPSTYVHTYGGSTPATAIVPNWTAKHTMDGLVFAVVQINYNREKGVTSLPNLRFHLKNDMYLAGDCLYDYMTNTTYGAGIKSGEILL